MKAVGIVAEYNPFHNGHLYQINKARQLSGCDYTVVVMSGSFVQRGDAAICDKWSRTKMALHCGADLVIELPVCYSAQSAEFFAQGAVRLLDSIGVEFISFGVENDNLRELKAAASVLSNETDEFKACLTQQLQRGISFPKAREEAAFKFGIKNILSLPNNILGIEYIKSIYKHSLNIIPLPVKRTGSRHDGGGSALFIRNNIEKAKMHMPKQAYEIFYGEISKGKAPVTLNKLENAIMSRLRMISAEELANISGVSEGLENRLKKASNLCISVNEVLEYVKTKRYVYSRLRRIIINCLLDIKNTDIAKQPEYIRVLGLNEKGRKVLNKAKENSDIKIITKVADAKSSDMLQQDICATNLYSLMYPNKSKRIGNLDYLTSPVYVDVK